MEEQDHIFDDFETTVNDLKAVVAIPVHGKDQFLVSMHKDAQAAALIRCVGVIQQILRDIICMHQQTEEVMMSPEEMAEYIKSELNLIADCNVEVLNHLHDLSVFLGMCNLQEEEDKSEFDELMTHMPDVCNVLTQMVEDFKG